MTDIPACLSHLPTYGGLPIPFVTAIDKTTGRPDFRATHRANHTLAQRFQLCGICGKHIPMPPYVFSVGPVCLEARGVFEPPMHEACARAAFTLCPFLSRELWERHETPREGSIHLYTKAEIPAKPARPGLAFVPSYRVVQNPENKLFYALLPEADFPVEWWVYVNGILQPETAPPDEVSLASKETESDLAQETMSVVRHA